MANSKVEVQFLDYSLERSTATFEGVEITAANFAAQKTLIDSLVGSLQAITLATKIKDSRTAVETKFTETRPTSPYAQRENKWLLRFTDNVNPTGNGSKEVPAPDLDLLNAEGTYLDLTSTEGAAFKTDFEAFQRSRLGNAVTLVSAQYVGRNN